jgi:hypothetical protein
MGGWTRRSAIGAMAAALALPRAAAGEFVPAVRILGSGLV